MSKQRQRGGGLRTLGAAAIVGLAVGLTAPGCSSSNNNDGGGQDAAPTDTGGPRPDSGNPKPDSGMPPADTGVGGNPDALPTDTGGGGCAPTGAGMVTGATAAAMTATTTFATPFNSVPSPDGTTIYFTADSPTGTGVFSVAATGGNATPLVVGDPFQFPIDVQISTDGHTLYVVDIGAEDMANVKHGRIFSLSTGGGTPAAISQADGTEPRGIDVIKMGTSDVIYWTGVDTDGASAVFSMNADGSNKMTVSKSSTFEQLGGIAVTKTGDVYVANGAGKILKISGGNVTEFVTGIQLGFPAGIALTGDESALLVSQYDPSTHGALLGRYALMGGTKTTFNTGLTNQHEAAGLHRARCADVYSWSNADGSKGSASGGVFVVK